MEEGHTIEIEVMGGGGPEQVEIEVNTGGGGAYPPPGVKIEVMGG